MNAVRTCVRYAVSSPSVRTAWKNLTKPRSKIVSSRSTSGRLPYSRALGFDQFILPDGSPDLFGDPGTARVLYERPFNALLPDYHRLDVTVERVVPFRAATLTVQAGLLNAYDRANLFEYDIFTLRRIDQLPVVPTLGLRLDTR